MRRAAFVAAVAAAALAVPAAADDMEIVRERARQLFGWPPADGMRLCLAEARWWAGQLNASGYWPDLNYTSEGRAVWIAAEHFARVQNMAAALTDPISPDFEKPSLSNATHLALGAWIFREPPFTNPNW